MKKAKMTVGIIETWNWEFQDSGLSFTINIDPWLLLIITLLCDSCTYFTFDLNMTGQSRPWKRSALGHSLEKTFLLKASWSWNLTFSALIRTLVIPSRQLSLQHLPLLRICTCRAEPSPRLRFYDRARPWLWLRLGDHDKRENEWKKNLINVWSSE
jgi:hypothetical protein